jgi:hypothetical protein
MDLGESTYIVPNARKRPWRNAGVPVDGVAGTKVNVADKGDLLVDTTNGTLYQNTGTKTNLTWTQCGTLTAFGLVADMAANGTAAANVVGVAAGPARVDHVHKIGVHDHSDNTKGSAIVETGITAASLTGLVAKVVADGNVIGGIPVLHKIVVAAGANGNTDVTLTHKTQVLDVWIRPTTTVVAATLQVFNVGDALSDAMVADTTDNITRAASLVEAQKTIAAGTVLRVTGAGGATMPAAEVYVLGIRVA